LTEDSEFDKSADFDKSNKGNNNDPLSNIVNQAKSKKKQLIKQLDQKLEEFVDEIIRNIDLKSLIETAVGRGQSECTFEIDTFQNDHRRAAVTVESKNNTMTFSKSYEEAYFAFRKRFGGELRLVAYNERDIYTLDKYQFRFKLEWD